MHIHTDTNFETNFHSISSLTAQERRDQMTRNERRQVSELVRTTECLLHENIALKLLLEHRQVSNWRRLLDRLLADKEILAGVHLRFRDIYREIEASENPSTALQNFVAGFSLRKPQ
jgi:hypothetical protein